MPRLFVGIDLPADIKKRLMTLEGGVPGARWQTNEQLHLTVRFIGDVERPVANDIAARLDGLRMNAFDIRLSSVGQFGDKRPHVIWAGLDDTPPLYRLASKVEQALQRLGLPPETRKYTPHITLARLKNPSRDRVFQFLSNHALFQSPSFAVSSFHLFESHLGSAGAIYQIVSSYSLSAPAGDPTPLPLDC